MHYYIGDMEPPEWPRSEQNRTETDFNLFVDVPIYSLFVICNSSDAATGG